MSQGRSGIWAAAPAAVASVLALAVPAQSAAAPAVRLAPRGGPASSQFAGATTLPLRVRARTAVRVRIAATARAEGGAQTIRFVRPATLRIPRGRSVQRLTLTAAARRLGASGCGVLTVRVAATTLAARRRAPAFTARSPVYRATRAYPAGRTCAQPPPGARFRVGAATRSVDPGEPVFAGGFGLSPPIQAVADPLSTRAMYVAGASHAVAFAVVDAQGYFAATQLAGDDGISEIRAEAARRVTALGGAPLAASDVIVQATHSHAAPTLQGIWGPVPPGYLQIVRERTVEALVEAAQRARPASLQWGKLDAPYIDNVATAQTDSYPGFTQDGQLTALRAVDPGDRSTIATFVNVPAHGDIVCGSCDKVLSADYFGVVRTAIERQIGGTAIVGPATLGREESPVQATSLDNMRWYSGTIGELALRAVRDAHWITDPTVASTESISKVAGTNAALLALVAAWSLPDEQKQQEADASGIYPIDRSVAPEWQAGSVISTPLTALRIGGLVFLSMPGEPFPEVRLSIANGAKDPDAIVALSKAQDDLGYFYPAFDYGFTFAYPSDHGTFNSAPQLGDQVIQEQLANIGKLGYRTDPTAPLPPEADYPQALRPGLQALASPARGDAGADGRFATTFQAIYSPADLAGNPIAGKVHWDFGDGSTADTDALQFGGDKNPPTRFEHRFAPGSYTVKLSAHDSAGNPASWEVPVVAYPRLEAVAKVVARSGRLWTVRGSLRGGDGRALALRWSFGDGSSASGAEVTHRFKAGSPATATLTVTDGTGSTAAARAR